MRDGLPERQGPLTEERGSGGAPRGEGDEVERESLAFGGDGAGVESPPTEPNRAGLTP